MKLLLFIFILIFNCSRSFALVELRGDFWFNKQVFAVDEQTQMQSSSQTQAVSGSFAWYLWNLTGIEIYGSRTEDVLTENTPTQVSPDFTILSSQSVAVTQSYGVGLRQALWSKEYRIVPTLSIGYARQFLLGHTEYVVDDAGSITRFKDPRERRRLNSGYIGLALRIRLTRRLGLTGSFRSIMEDFKRETWNNNLQYTVGISLIL